LEVVWDKSDVVHMDDALAVPATGGFYKSVAHHFYEVSFQGSMLLQYFTVTGQPLCKMA